MNRAGHAFSVTQSTKEYNRTVKNSDFDGSLWDGDAMLIFCSLVGTNTTHKEKLQVRNNSLERASSLSPPVCVLSNW